MKKNDIRLAVDSIEEFDKNREFILCECYSFDHVWHLFYDEDDDLLYVTSHLRTGNIFKRIIVAIKYVLGYRSRFGEFDEFLIGEDQANKVIKLLSRIGDNKDE